MNAQTYVETITVDMDGIKPFETGELTFKVDIQPVGLAEMEVEIELLNFEATAPLQTEGEGVFELSLAADFTEEDDA